MKKNRLRKKIRSRHEQVLHELDGTPVWLTPLRCSPCLVYPSRLGKKVGKTRDGWVLDAPLAWRVGNNLWIRYSGYSWDGASYPSMLAPVVGRKNKEAILAASAAHDDMGGHTCIHRIDTEQLDSIALLFAEKESVIKKILEKETPKYIVPISIIRGASLYRRLLRAWGNDGQSISRRKAVAQQIGLLLFQRKIRLLTLSKNNKWKKL